MSIDKHLDILYSWLIPNYKTPAFTSVYGCLCLIRLDAGGAMIFTIGIFKGGAQDQIVGGGGEIIQHIHG